MRSRQRALREGQIKPVLLAWRFYYVEKQKRGTDCGSVPLLICLEGRLPLRHVRSLKPLRALLNLELDEFSFGQGFETVTTDRGVVDKNVFATVLFNEAVTLAVVEPLDCALRQLYFTTFRLVSTCNALRK